MRPPAVGANSWGFSQDGSNTASPFSTFIFLLSVEATEQTLSCLLRRGGDGELPALFSRTLLSAQPYHPRADGGPAGKISDASISPRVREMCELSEQDLKAVVKALP